MKIKNLKSTKGITLVALVIIIIILLILAGISIATLTNSGLFENARLAEQESKNAQELEDTTLKDYENQIDSYVSGNRDYESEITKLKERINKLENPWELIGTVQITNGTGSISIAKKYKKIKLNMGGMLLESTEILNDEAHSMIGGYYFNDTSSPYINYFSVVQNTNSLLFSGAGWSQSSSTPKLRTFSGEVYGIPQ